MRKKTFWLMLFIVTLGTILRLIFIDKPDGLWNDEYVSWAVASIPFGKKFIDAIFAQCHMPFYYLYLKFFIHYFGNSDLTLRLTSVLAGILSIISMYFVGKELKDEKLGILCASITSLSSFLIYFSQEVRLYEILFLFASLSLLFTLKLGRKQNFLNLIFYVISNFLIIFTHTIGFIFVFFNLIFLSFWLGENEKYKKPIITIWCSLALLTLVNLPLMFKIFTYHPLSQWWGHFTFSKIGFLITDYFSPVLTNIVSAPDNFFYNFNLRFVIFALIPSAVAVIGIIKALTVEAKRRRGEEAWGNSYASTHPCIHASKNSPFTIHHSLFTICLAFILILILMAISGQLLFITKYSMEIYPILIMIMAYGLLEIKKGWRYFLIFLFCFLNLFYILKDSNSAPKMHRSEGHKIVAELIKNAGLSKNDFILLNYYPQDRFEKYFDFSKYSVFSINKRNFSDYLGVQNKDDFKNVNNNNNFNQKFKKEVLDKLKSNQKIAVVVLNDVAIYSPTKIYALLKDKKEYEKAPFLFLVFSQVKNDILENCLRYLQIQRVEEKGSWSVITFKKN